MFETDYQPKCIVFCNFEMASEQTIGCIRNMNKYANLWKMIERNQLKKIATISLLTKNIKNYKFFNRNAVITRYTIVALNVRKRKFFTFFSPQSQLNSIIFTVEYKFLFDFKTLYEKENNFFSVYLYVSSVSQSLYYVQSRIFFLLTNIYNEKKNGFSL